ncbi:MAG TPA: hypothetical protein VNY73_03235 [Bacteroidia bacterium]|jgi:hypothetical protein|nr:hypothetical protein [Bacteroidia bacterium]
MMTETIFTLDARDNIYLDVAKDYFKLDENTLYNEINGLLKDLIITLSSKKIKYQDLKTALIPSNGRNEIAFVFDTLQIESSWYGLPVFKAFFPLLDKQSSNSVLVGDYIGDDKITAKLRSAFFENIKSDRKINYQHHSQYYIVYINNLSDKMLETINNGLKSFNPYIGYFDLTYSSFIKTYLSTILVRLFLKHKTIILQEHEDDFGNDKDSNISGYPFEDYGYTCRSVQSTHYSLFLSYKIERQVFKGFESDTTFSINAITKNVFDITDFNLLVEEKKFAHLLKAKAESLERAGVANLTLEQVESLIKEKINSNYLYNLTYLKSYDTLKFDILIETTRVDNNEPFKLTVALEYKPTDKILRLITMF